jgi:hypothetical protein
LLAGWAKEKQGGGRENELQLIMLGEIARVVVAVVVRIVFRASGKKTVAADRLVIPSPARFLSL